MTRANLILAAGLTLVVFVLAACGGDDAPEAAEATAAAPTGPAAAPTTSVPASPAAQAATSASPLDDPCSLVTADEVRSLLGDATAPKATKARGASSCVWESAGSRSRVLNIIVETDVTAWRRDISDTITRGTGKPVDVGDVAFVTSERVTFVKGNVAVQVQVLSVPAPPADALVALGKAIAARL